MDSNEVVSAFQNDSLGSDDAVSIADKIKKGELSASLVTQDAIERAKAVNPKLNAISVENFDLAQINSCLLYTSPSPRDSRVSRMPSSA